MSNLVTNNISPLNGDAVTFTGGVTGSTASFDGNVSVGGTLSTEEVSNIDSVGVLTARNGIEVEANGINAVGVVTATSFTGDGSKITGIDLGGLANFVASGAIPEGAS